MELEAAWSPATVPRLSVVCTTCTLPSYLLLFYSLNYFDTIKFGDIYLILLITSQLAKFCHFSSN